MPEMWKELRHKYKFSLFYNDNSSLHWHSIITSTDDPNSILHHITEDEFFDAKLAMWELFLKNDHEKH